MPNPFFMYISSAGAIIASGRLRCLQEIASFNFGLVSGERNSKVGN